LREDAALRHEMGAANRARAERDYRDESMFQTYAALFEETDAASGRNGSSG
jgi:hypothetical protein